MPEVINFIFGTKNFEKRDAGIDLVKTIAAVFVPSVHFFLNNGYYDLNMTDPLMLIPTVFRWLFLLGVPLFLLSTGYLKRNTDFTVLHYVKLLPIIVTALLAGGAVMFYRIRFEKEELPLFLWLRSLWSFEQPSYAWYVNMYLCLSLMMPFICYGWNAVESRRKKQMMIVVFAILTSLPAQINNWKIPIQYSETNLGYAPNMWTVIYPVTYFLIGAYIGEYKPKTDKRVLALILIVSIMYQSVKSYLTADKGNFYDGVYAYYEDLITVFTGTALFLLIYDIKINNKAVRAVLASISNVTLGLYLLSFIGDCVLYKQYDFSTGIKSMPLGYLKTVPVNFAVSFIGAVVINIITRLVTAPVIKYAASCQAALKKEIFT